MPQKTLVINNLVHFIDKPTQVRDQPYQTTLEDNTRFHNAVQFEKLEAPKGITILRLWHDVILIGAFAPFLWVVRDGTLKVSSKGHRYFLAD